MEIDAWKAFLDLVNDHPANWALYPALPGQVLIEFSPIGYTEKKSGGFKVEGTLEEAVQQARSKYTEYLKGLGDAYTDEMRCIGCGQKSKGTYRGLAPSELADAKEASDAVFENLGWRKVPGGWKCTNCTGIRGRASR